MQTKVEVSPYVPEGHAADNTQELEVVSKKYWVGLLEQAEQLVELAKQAVHAELQAVHVKFVDTAYVPEGQFAGNRHELLPE